MTPLSQRHSENYPTLDRPRVWDSSQGNWITSSSYPAASCRQN